MLTSPVSRVDVLDVVSKVSILYTLLVILSTTAHGCYRSGKFRESGNGAVAYKPAMLRNISGGLSSAQDSAEFAGRHEFPVI